MAELMAIYWTFLDFPDWLLQSEKGWFILAFVSKTDYKRIEG
jgi:hypothetical protein